MGDKGRNLRSGPAGFLTVTQHCAGLFVVFLTDDDLGGHGADIYSLRIVDQMPALSSMDLLISASVMVLYSASTTKVSSCIIFRFWLDI